MPAPAAKLLDEVVTAEQRVLSLVQAACRLRQRVVVRPEEEGFRVRVFGRQREGADG